MLPQFQVEVGVVITPNPTWIRKRLESQFIIIIISTYIFFHIDVLVFNHLSNMIPEHITFS